MKARIKIKKGIIIITLLLSLFPVNIFSQACERNEVTVSISNLVSDPKTSTIEFDVTITNTSSNTIKLASLSGALIHKIDFATSGIFTVVTEPSAADFPNFNNIISTDYSPETRQLRWTNNPVKEKLSITLPAGVIKKFARFSFKRTNSNSSDFDAKLKFQEFVQKGYTALNAIVYCNGNSNYTALANRKINNSKGYLIVAENGVTDSKVNLKEFTAYTFPNPFTDNFKIDVATIAETSIEISVYDMLGKLMEKKIVEKSELKNLNLGANYPSGIYNVNVSQGENSQTIRIIRK